MYLAPNGTHGNKGEQGMPVDLNARFNNAWFEVNTRLSLRQNAITVYAALMSFVISGLGLAPNTGTTIAQWIVFLVPLLSLLFSALIFMHDSIIRNLCAFILECEVLGNQAGDNALPNYLADTKWSVHDDRIRTLHHIVCAVLIVIFNAIAFFVANEMHANLFTSRSAIMWVQIGVAFLAVLVALATILPKKTGGCQPTPTS